MKIPSLSLALAVGVALVVVPVAGAQAAAPVTIQKIPTTTVKFDTTKTVKPRYVAQKNVKVDKAVLKVVKDGRVVVKEATSVKLGKGSYRVRQAVTYRTVTRPASREDVVVPAGDLVDASCGIDTIEGQGGTSGWYEMTCQPLDSATLDFADQLFQAAGNWKLQDTGDYLLTFAQEAGHTSTATVAADAFREDEIVAVKGIEATRPLDAARLVPAEYGAAKTVSTSQKLTVKSLKEPKGCASKAEYRSVRTGYDELTESGTGSTFASVAKTLDQKGRTVHRQGIYQTRRYPACAPGEVVHVNFIKGRASAKQYGKVDSGQ